MTADPAEKTLTVCVTDTGAGIQDVKKGHGTLIYNGYTGERSGMGFSFMEAFMDEVTVESEPGKGTAVTMKKHIGR